MKRLIPFIVEFAIAVIAVFAVGAIVLFAGKPPVSYPPILSHSSADWQTDGSVIPLYQEVDGFSVVIPEKPDTSCSDFCPDTCAPVAGYIFSRKVPAKISGSLSVTFRIEVLSGNPAFQFKTECNNNGNTPASIRFLIWSKNNSWADGKRWWSWNVATELQPGIFTMIVPIHPSNFSGVNGQLATQDLKQWNAAINDVSSLGVTLGGGSFYGHGVYTTDGQSKIRILNYEVQQ